MSNELNDKIEQLLSNEIVDRHSLFQLKYFVVGKEPTIQARLWRCLQELEARKGSIDSLELEIDETKDKIELSEIEIRKIERNRSDYMDELLIQESEIRQRQILRKKTGLERSLKSLQKKLKYVLEEAEFFVKAFQSLEKIESLKPYDDLASQTEYWNEKLNQEVNIRLLFGNPLDTELMKTVLALDDKVPVKQQIVNVLAQEQRKQLEKAKEKEKNE